MKRIVIIGARGMLGHAACRVFESRGYDVVPVSRETFDIATDHTDKLEPLLEGADAVFNAAGVIKPRIATMPIEHVLRVNSIFPRNLARICSKRNLMCFHVTTDCVYSGARGRYDEQDLFDADDVYGLSKNAGDTVECMTVRTSIIGEERGDGRSLLAWAQRQAGKEVSGFTNHLWNGLTTVHLAETVEAILDRQLYRRGIVHLHSPSPVTKYDLLAIFNDVYGLRLTVRPTLASQPCDRTLASSFVLSQHLVTKTIQQQVRDMKTFFESHSSTIRIPLGAAV